MDERLEQVAESGDIIAMHQLIGEDVNLLDHIDEKQYVQTPLHIAAFAGKIQFATEVMGLKPSFAQKLNPDGFTPIHLALKNGHIELVRQLLEIDRDLAHVKGKECITPLHYVVETGDRHIDLLDKFLLVSPNSIAVCPDSITDVTMRNETDLYIALKNDNLEAFEFFMGWLAINSFEPSEFNKRTILNWKDNEGNTVLHILFCHRRNIYIYILSFNYPVAWDILREDNREIRDMLRRAGAKPGSSLPTFNRYQDPKFRRLLTVLSWVDHIVILRREIRKFTVERRSMLLVVAALLVTLSFQAVLTPPGGLWPDNGRCMEIPPFNETSNTTLMCEHKAGTAIALNDGLFSLFVVCNTMLFSISTSLIALLLVLNIIVCLSYFYSVWTITNAPILMILLVFYFILEAMIRLSAMPQQHTKQGQPLLWKEPLF
ncbi:hypothetical protein ACB092_11G265200 [Castanea dentata]